MKFTYKPVYVENNKKILEMNVLPEKYCNFDCIFCPIGRAKTSKEDIFSIGDIDKQLLALQEKINTEKPDLIFINSMGEALVHSKIKKIITFIHHLNLPIKLLSNGYLFGVKEYAKIAGICEEVIGEIKTTNNDDFHKIQRPISNYTLEEHIENMAKFNKTYKGKFILEVTIIKGYSDDNKSIILIKEFINRIKPNEIIITSITDDIFVKKLGISNERLREIQSYLLK